MPLFLSQCTKTLHGTRTKYGFLILKIGEVKTYEARWGFLGPD